MIFGEEEVFEVWLGCFVYWMIVLFIYVYKEVR